MCVLMSTHTLAAAEEISHRVGIMSHGKLMFDGTIDELRQRFPGGPPIARIDVPGDDGDCRPRVAPLPAELDLIRGRLIC